MKALSQSMDESVSAAILQDTEIVYVARMPAPYRILSTTITVGTRLPAFHTSLGRARSPGFWPRTICGAGFNRSPSGPTRPRR